MSNGNGKARSNGQAAVGNGGETHQVAAGADPP